MPASYSWNRVAPPSGYVGECYAWGNYLVVAVHEGVYTVSWHLLRRQGGGGYNRVPGCPPFKQTFAVRPRAELDVEEMLKWAEEEIIKYRSRRMEPRSDMF